MSDLFYSWPVDYSTKAAATPRILAASYGDGYEQRTGDGINTNPRTWSVSWTSSTSLVEEAESFLDDRAGVETFLWTTPKGAVALMVCKQYDVQYVDFNKSTLTAVFSQVYEGPLPTSGGVLDDFGITG